MRKIYIDAGGFSGDTVSLFEEKYPDANQFEIFCFEPNPDLFHFHENKKYKFLPYAVWIENCDLNFYVASNPTGSTLMKSKYNAKILKSIKVKALDISEWIKNSFSINDYIVLKMDIEGAEYDVLQHMIDHKSILYVKEIFVDWHRKKMGNFNHEKYSHLPKTLRTIGLKCGDMCGESQTLKWYSNE
jgi:FkbM family methyltransferase